MNYSFLFVLPFKSEFAVETVLNEVVPGYEEKRQHHLAL